jgi:hypothetical protein
MSNLDLLTPLESAEAARHGWSLSHVYDLETARWRVMVLGMPNAEAVGQQIVGLARAGSPLAQKALSLVMSSNKG